LKIPIEDSDKYLISSHFESVFLFIEEALKSNNSPTQEMVRQEYFEIDYSSNQVQKMLKCFKEYYDLYFEKKDNELITGNDIDKIQDLQIKNKVCQLLIKYHYANFINNNKILIHCSMGISRSPSLIIMYLMKKIKISFLSVT